MNKLFVIDSPYGLICELCYSDSPEFEAHHPNMAPGFHYLADEEVIRSECCEGCDEPWEPIISESERMEMWCNSESDPDDVERPSF